MCNTFNLELKKWCWRSFGFVSVLVLGMCYIGSVQADVCFLPSGNCLSDTNLAAPQNYGGEDCSTYTATYRQQHLEYAADCVTCGGREYCKCGSDRKIVGNACVCRDSDKIIKNGSCTACPSNKEKASETTCQCKSIYNYTPGSNEVCSDSCSEEVAISSSSFAPQISNNSGVLSGTYGQSSNTVSGSSRMMTALELYNKGSCYCVSGYEYVGVQCLEKCDSSKGLTRSGTECVCSDSKKEWSNTENKCVCKTEYDPDGNGGCLMPGCQNPHQVRVNGTCQCDTNSGYYDSIDICQLYLPSTQAYNLNWWDLLQQKATNAVYEVAQCLMPVKAAYAEQQVNTMDGTENYAGNLNGGVGELDSGLPVYGGGASGGTTGGGLGNSDTPNQGTDGNGYFRPSIDTGNDNHLDEGIEARCRRKCAGSAGTAFSSCMADCMEYGLLNDNLQGTTVGIDGEYDGPVGGGSSVPTAEYECVTDDNVCWYTRKKQQTESEDKYLYVMLYSSNWYDTEILSGDAEQISCRENDCFNVTDNVSQRGEMYYSVRRYKIRKGAEVTIKSTACKDYVPESWMGTLSFDGNGTDTITITFSENITSGLGDNYWGTIDTEPEEWVTIEPDYAEYDSNYFPTLGGCIDGVGACKYDSVSRCYVQNNVPARIYCNYDDMLQTGDGCWGSTPWYDQPCEGELSTPCEVDYQVTANNGSQGITVCPGAQYARNKQNNSSGPIEIPAGTYDLYVSYVGKLGYGHSKTNFTDWNNHNDLVYEYWVPDVMLVMDNVSVNSFKCYNIMSSGANKNSCSIPSKVKVQDELINSGLYNWASYDQGMDSLKDCNVYETDRTYDFKAGKTYYIHVGSSGSHTSDVNCTYAWGCGYRDN